MKKIISIMLFINCLLVSLGNAQTWITKKTFEREIITTTGKAEIGIPADLADFSFSVTGFAKDLNTAIEQARQKVDLIANKLFKAGLKNKNLSTTKFVSSENMDDKAFLSSARDFKATLNVKVRVDSISLLESIITQVSLMNPDHISSITFSLKNIEAAKNNALIMAVEKAKEKASLLCTNLNIKLGQAIYVEEGLAQNQRYSNIMAMKAGVSNQTMNISSFFVKPIKVQATVQVIFAIISKQ